LLDGKAYYRDLFIDKTIDNPDQRIQQDIDIFTANAGGTPNVGYTWLTTTNLSIPITWTTNLQSTLDGSGAFSNSIPISTTTPARFFRLRMP